MRTFILMLQFMTRYPIAMHIDFTADRFVGGMKWMPVVGLCVGLPAGLLFFVTAPVLGSEVSSFLALVYLITVTGGIHLDGMGDTADGLFSYRPRERVLEIMRDSTLGTNGVIAVVLTIICKLLLLKNGAPAACVAALICGPIIGRMTIAWHAALVPYARDGKGMGDFTDQVQLPHACAALASSFFLIMVILPGAGLTFGSSFLLAALSHLFAVAIAVAFAFYLRSRIGGITGDTFGATIELTEMTTFLLFFLTWDYLI